MKSNNIQSSGLKAVDFFCGAGGMTCGLKISGIDVVAGIDNDPECEQTYLLNNAPAKYLLNDVAQLHPRELTSNLGINRWDDSLILVGCSPCQYWSKVNTERRHSSLTKNLLYEFQRFVEYLKPGFIVIENVPGLFNNRNKNTLITFIDFLTFNKYSHSARIVDASNYGVPQKRKRFLLIATRLSNTSFFPEEDIKQPLSVKDVLGVEKGFFTIEDGFIDKTDFIHTTAKLSQKNKARIACTPHNGGDRRAWRDNPDLQIPAYEGKDNIFRDVYSRLFWEKPAPTITTRFNSLSNGRFGHPEEDRALSLREGATLQTFPKNYIFKGGQASIAKQIGNAVPPELAKRIGLSIIENWKKHQLIHFEPKQEQLIF